MVEYIRGTHSDSKQLDLIFHALADEIRRNLLDQITNEPMKVTDLANNYDVSLNAISKHIKVLEKAGLVQRKIDGRKHYCQMNPTELAKAQKWIEQYEKFWLEKLDSLKKFVAGKTN